MKHIEVEEVLPPVEMEEIPRYRFQRISKEEAFERAKIAAAGKKRVLWICNTVARAQEVLKKLQGEGVASRTYHSRFKYKDRVRQHRKVIRWFGSETHRVGIVAVTTQVAEMSLDLDADVLISEIAPIPALIQRLGRLNRRVTPENQANLRTAYFLDWEKPSPYKNKAELRLAEQWIEALAKSGKAIRQTDLSAQFSRLSPTEKLHLDVRTAWLDSGWFATPEPVRDIGHSVSVILPEDERPCRERIAEIIKRAIPMNYSSVMKDWTEWKTHLLAPPGAIHYDKRTGAVLLWKK